MEVQEQNIIPNPPPPFLPHDRRISLLDFLNEHVLAKLNDRERRIAMWRQLDVFGFGVNEKTYKEIGEIEGRSVERLRQVCLKARRRVDYRMNIIAEAMKTPHVVIKRVAKEDLEANVPMRQKFVYDLGFLTVRTANCLKNEGLELLDKLLEKKEYEMLRIPNFGRKSLNELKALLALHDLKFSSQYEVNANVESV